MREAAEESGILAGSQIVDDTASLEERDQSGLDAPVAIVCGDPAYVASVYTGHRLRYLVLAPNSNGIPPAVKMFLTEQFMDRPRLDGFLAPSEWAADVLRREFPEHDVLVAPHGVSREFRYGQNRAMRESLCGMYNHGRFFVIHITSTASDRKGTPQLIEAWRKLSWKGAKLLIYCHPMHLEQHHELTRGANGVAVMPTMGMSDSDLYLNYSAAHVICQPSRAEGFGLVPLEARCSGVPVVMTGATGHSQHVNCARSAGTVYVFSGDDGTSDDYVGATAPTVSATTICDALALARESWMNLHNEAITAAPILVKEWTWRNQNEVPLRKLIKKAELEDT